MAFIAAMVCFGCKTDDASAPAVVGIDLEPSEVTLTQYDTFQLTATVYPPGAAAVSWSSSIPNTVSVNGGLITALRAGSSTITASAGGFSARCSVVVNPFVEIDTVSIAGATTSVLVNGTLPLTAVITPAEATNKNVQWSSSDTAIATVDADGVVTGVSNGTATITVTSVRGNKTADYQVTVTSTAVAVTGVTLDENDLELTKAETVQLTATIAPSNATTPGLTWTIAGDPPIVTLTGTGNVVTVTPVAFGNTTITVKTTDGDFTDSCTIKIEPARDSVEVEGETLVHYLPYLTASTGAWGTEQGTENDDGSYTYVGTGNTYTGGGCNYHFPSPGPGATWKLSDYYVVELDFTVDGTVSAVQKLYNNGDEPARYPGTVRTINPFITGKYTFAIPETKTTGGLGFQRNTSTGATVTLNKATFSKGTVHTITFTGGDYAAMPEIAPVKILTGRTVGFDGAYLMPANPTRPGFDFDGWFNATDNVNFNASAAISKDLTLSAKWAAIAARTITFNTDGGVPATIAALSVANEGTMGASYPVPTKEGFVFDGWWTDGYKQYLANTPVLSNLTLKARWVTPYATGTNYQVPLSGLLTRNTIPISVKYGGYAIPFNFPAGFNIANYASITITAKVYNSSGELATPGWGWAWAGYTTADVSGWTDTQTGTINNGTYATVYDFLMRSNGTFTLKDAPGSAGAGAAIGSQTPTALLLIADNPANAPYIAVESITFTWGP